MSILRKIIFSSLIILLNFTQLYAGQNLIASYYSVESLHKDGQWNITKGKMSNGKEFKDADMVCASWDYPLNCMLLVKNLSNGLSVVVKNSDRTARRFKGKRCDLSKGAFSRIANCKSGIIPISIEVVK